MPLPSPVQMGLLQALLSDPRAGGDARTFDACRERNWIATQKGSRKGLGWEVTEEGRKVIAAGAVSNDTGKVNMRVPDDIREAVRAKLDRIGGTYTGVFHDALRTLLAETDEESAFRLETRLAAQIWSDRTLRS